MFTPRLPATRSAASSLTETSLPAAAIALRAGLAQGEIGVLYQPVVRLSDRRPLMLEALARWRPRRSTVLPDQFVPLIEQAGLARPLALEVLRRIAAELVPLSTCAATEVSINLPLSVVLQPQTPAWLAQAITPARLRAGSLVIELTETTVVMDRSGLDRALRRLAACGFRVLLDDLGLDDPRAALLELPFAGCKLDRSLVEALPHSARARLAVRTIVRAASARGQTVTAEGISDPRLWAAARGLGCDRGQGFAIGRPLAAPDLLAWCRSWRAGMGPR